VRIGIDMLGLQSAGSRNRGIGRLGRNLLERLLPLDPAARYVFYAHDGLPTDAFPTAPNAVVRPLAVERDRGERTIGHAMDRLARTNPDGLDVLLTLSPFELHGEYGPPARPLGGPKLAAVVHDLIPFVYQEHYLVNHAAALRLYRHLERLRRYDVLLANSDATRADFLRMLNLPEGRVVTVGAASDTRFIDHGADPPGPLAARRALHELGVSGAFVFSVSNIDHHKNLRTLIEAFALLPPALRLTHQLVVTCGIVDHGDAERVRAFAAARGVGDRLVLTSGVDDEALRALYQHCAVFCLPSLYEGFGLPILEAMRCGAAVVAGNNSSQVEVVGDAGLLANVGDAGDLSSKLAAVLADPALARALGDRARDRVGRFTWDAAAERTLAALRRVAAPAPRGRRLRADAPHAPRPRIAMYAPLPPKPSGVGTYTLRLIDELKNYYTIDLYHDSGYVPDVGLASADFGCFDHRLLARRAGLVDYRAVVYHMGNSYYHKTIFEHLRARPGIAVLHDFCLSGFQWWYAHLHDAEPGHFAREVEAFDPRRAAEILGRIDTWKDEPGGIQDAFARRGLYLNRAVFDRSLAVVVHSGWCRDEARRLFPEHESKTEVIPHGATPVRVERARRDAIRDRYAIPREALVVASFGYVTRGKMIVEAVEAFAEVARAVPGAIYVVVGKDCEGGESRRKAEELGLADRVRFLGRRSDAEFLDLVAAADVGVALRRPPTYGETSGALLDLLRHGVATVVADVGTFADYPEGVVRKIPWDADAVSALGRALLGLARDGRAREALGRSAFEYVDSEHHWKRAAAMYADVIERCAPGRAPATAGRAEGAWTRGVCP
jgi:glycosyltransferase involved in cell wall biosynthesis